MQEMQEMQEENARGMENRGIFEKFAAQLEEYTKTQQSPEYGDQDVRYYLELQQNRLKKKNLKLEYRIVPRGIKSDQTYGRDVWRNEKYRKVTQWRTCALTRIFFRNNTQIYKKEANKTFYQTVTFLRDGKNVEDESYVCPNCGAISTVRELQTGCSYCRTHFIIQDLFPKVNDFFFMNDYSLSKKEFKREIWKYATPWMVFFAIMYLVKNLHGSPMPFWLVLLLMVPAVVLSGYVMGYITLGIIKIAGLFADASKSIRFLSVAIGSSNKFENYMRQHNPEFSYEYFTNKVVSLLKMIAFSEDATEIPNYSGPSAGNLFSDIVEMSFFGIVLKNFYEKDDMIFVTVTLHMDDLYERNGKFLKKSDKFCMILCRRKDRLIEYDFSIKKVTCKNCGASFDATKNKICPYCKTQYEIVNDDWIVTEIIPVKGR